MAKINSNVLLSIFAIIVSVSALVVSIRETAIMKEQSELMINQQRTSVWPYVTVDQNFSYGDRGAYTMYMTNKGIGPAIVKISGIQINKQEAPEYLNMISILSEILPPNTDWGLSTSLANERILRSDEQVNLISLEFERFENDYDIVGKILFEYDICYCSIYEECWAANDYRTKISCDSTVD